MTKPRAHDAYLPTDAFTFVEETEICIPLRRTIRVEADGSFEVLQDEIPGRGQLSMACVWGSATARERSAIEENTRAEVRRKIEAH